MSGDVVYLEIDKSCDKSCTCNKGDPEQHKNGHYCSNYHTDGGKVIVTCEHPESISIPYHKHSIDDQNFQLAGIKYNEGGGTAGTRRNITLNGLDLPISDVESISVIYCTGNGPALIYVQGGGSATGWYRKDPSSVTTDSEEWTRAPELSGAIPETINNGTYRDKLLTALNSAGCTGYSTCPCPKPAPPPPGPNGEVDPGVSEAPLPAQPTSETEPTYAKLLGFIPASMAGKILSGVFGGSGAVGLAGYHLYKNSRDPWVRQI